MNFKDTYLKLENIAFLATIALSITVGQAQAEGNLHKESNTIAAIYFQSNKQTVTGTVKDEAGSPLPGATVLEVGTNNGVITDFDGKFTIQLKAGASIQVSYIGYKPMQLAASTSPIDVQLELDASQLNEVLVIGYGNQTKADVTGSLTKLDRADFKQGINLSPDNLLQGKVAGVRVVNSSGEPGAGIDVTIRGVGSIRSGSTPLFVVDGVPLANDNVSPGGTNVGFGSSNAKNPLNFLNTSDIESINVLKDASAAAIYGARGSNGVVIITTKKGNIGEPTLNFESSMGFSNVANKLDVLSASEYRNAIEDPAFDHGGNTDWQDEIYRTGVTYNNSLSFAKATESGNYYVSLSNIDQEGIVKQSDFQRTTGRINASESFFDDERLNLQVNLTASETIDHGVPTSDDGGSDGQLIIHTLMANPTWPLKDADGEYTNFNMNAHYNPAYLLSIYEDETRTVRVLGNAQLSFRIIDGLTYKMNVGVDRSTSERNTTIYPNLTDRSPNGMYVQSDFETTNSLIEHYLTYSLLNNTHKLDVLAGFSYQKFERSGTTFGFDNLSPKGEGVKPENNPTPSNSLINISGFAQENELQSYFGRINYAYNGKYMVTASMRADGSTRFGSNNKYGYFPSFALGWNLTKEDFLSNTNTVNNLKLRASWGQTGNQEVQNKITQESYALSGSEGYYLYDNLDLVNGVTILRTPNPDLKWEVVTQFNVGLDFTLFNEKLYGTFDFFNKATTDAILNIPSPVLSPSEDVWVNMDGKIVNTGFELTLGSTIVKTDNFSWNLDVNGAAIHNEIKDLPVSYILSGKVSGPGMSGVQANIFTNGHSAGSFYLYEHAGFDENGFDVFTDRNNDGSINIQDKFIYDGALPKVTYGLNSQMRYKNFDLSLAFIGQAGGYLFNNTALNAININNLASDRNVATDYYESGANPANSPTASSYYLEKSDFFRLNTARLGYNFKTANINWLHGVNLYVTGTNLFTITNYSGYDPLINSPKATGGNQSIGIDYTSYPTARTFILGVNVKF